MPILMCIGFDNPNRLRRNVYYLAYRGVRFKLMQGHPRLSRDVLMSIAPSRDDGTAQQRIYEAAGEFLSALSWKNGFRIAFDYVGHVGAPEAFRLRQAKLRWTGPPQVPHHGHALGFDIDPIPSIQTDKQRLALAMFREAYSCNNVLLSFLLYWQIIEIGRTRAVDWVNKYWSRPPRGFHVPRSDIQKLPLLGQKLGQYLEDDCRHAIAHIRRRKGSRTLKFDKIDEVARLAFSTNVVRRFARLYIEKALRLTKEMYLVWKGGRSFPEYVEKSSVKSRSLRPAYSWSAPIAKQPRLGRPLRSRNR